MASIIRIPYLVLLINTEDYSYHKFKDVMWATTELAFAISYGCLPILPRLFQHLWAIPVSSESDLFVQANKGKSADTAGRLDERQRDWVPLREITKPSGPQPLY